MQLVVCACSTQSKLRQEEWPASGVLDATLGMILVSHTFDIQLFGVYPGLSSGFTVHPNLILEMSHLSIFFQSFSYDQLGEAWQGDFIRD